MSKKSSVTKAVGKPPISISAENRMMDDVPQQKARSHASFEGMMMSKKNRCSSGKTSEIARLLWIGSGLKKCCGVCTMPTAVSLNRLSARETKLKKGTKSASSTAMNSGGDGSRAKCPIAGLILRPWAGNLRAGGG